MLVSSRAVMKHLPSDMEDAQTTVTFVSADDDTGRVTRTVQLDHRDFLAFGSPEQITVTVEPDDLLNQANFQ